MKKYYIAALALIILFAIAPFASAFLASAIANSAGCTLNEAGSHSCIIHGHDYGDTLYTMGMSLWLMIFTFPVAQAAFILWVIVLVIHLVIRRRKNRHGRPVSQQPPSP